MSFQQRFSFLENILKIKEELLDQMALEADTEDKRDILGDIKENL
jgi:hypothetical protein